MKCPKCGCKVRCIGNNLDSKLYRCPKCGECWVEFYKEANTTLTPQEMWYWLSKNAGVIHCDNNYIELQSFNILYSWIEYQSDFPFYIRDSVEVIFLRDRDASIYEAYKLVMKKAGNLNV